MKFQTARVAKLAGLLKESVTTIDNSELEEADDLDEADMADELDESPQEVYEIDESELQELEESFDLRRVIRDEISRSLKSRDMRNYEYTSGQVHGRRTRSRPGTVTMGFPGIGFKR